MENDEITISYIRGDRVLDTYERREGLITGKYREGSDSIKWEVAFNEHERMFIDQKYLEPVNLDMDPFAYFNKQLYGTVADARRLMNHIRMKGELTNIYYSMYNSRTEFMPHQFQPVLKFIESTSGRLLIADEVGLGKTIEALYIWKELVARENAKRLLLLVPSALKEKWLNDMALYFGIEAEIVDAAGLFKKLTTTAEFANKHGFVVITSLEGIRYKDVEDFNHPQAPAREKLAELLERVSSTVTDKLFDLVIIDEAHYLRNSSTANYKTGARLRDVSNSLILLSATPIQTSQENLFNLMQLMDPEKFYDKRTFEFFIEENHKLVSLANAIRNNECYSDIEKKLQIVESSFLVQNDPYFTELKESLRSVINSPTERMKAFLEITSRYFYSQYINRNRKRDVFEKRIFRRAETCTFTMTKAEKEVYDRISSFLQRKARECDRFSVFGIISRQRQMTSSLPAAITQWKINDEDDDIQQWEDLGTITENPIKTLKIDLSEIICDIDNKDLKQNDSKYMSFRDTIRKMMKEGTTKIVVFSFYRGTISYITTRLNEDGIYAVSILGGMGEEKNRVIERFKTSKDITVLVSSEVGSEGIDLQFANVEINYDLPWNPMRLEQRIGRIDRIGQKSPSITILNLICQDTIEDRVLSKLYERIDIFKNSIGDIEEILGNSVQDIAVSLLNSELTPEEKEKQASQAIEAIAHKKLLCDELESKASFSTEYQEYLLRNINISATNGRYISSDELKQYILDFFNTKYPGCRIESHESTNGLIISLSIEARESLSTFIKSKNANRKTVLAVSSSGVLCVFDLHMIDKVKRGIFEFVDISHPLIRWINQETGNSLTGLNSCSLIKLHETEVPDYENGVYIYNIQEWKFDGFLNKHELHVFVSKEDGSLLDEQSSEYLFMKALSHGSDITLWKNILPDTLKLQSMMEICNNYAWDSFEENEKHYLSKNILDCQKQLLYLQETHNRKIKYLQETIINQKINKINEGIIKMNEKKLKNQLDVFELQRQKMERKVDSRCVGTDISVGIIVVV